MNENVPSSSYRDPLVTSGLSGLHSGRHLCWGAIIAGVISAMALEVLFVLLGAALGFALYTPLTDSNPGASFGTGAVIIEGISAVVSLWFGGWVAGRFTPNGGPDHRLASRLRRLVCGHRRRRSHRL